MKPHLRFSHLRHPSITPPSVTPSTHPTHAPPPASPLARQAIPFLAELLEDTEPEVEARAQRLVAQLEALSGEKLDQYMKT
jgi:hypothetical protein